MRVFGHDERRCSREGPRVGARTGRVTGSAICRSNCRSPSATLEVQVDLDKAAAVRRQARRRSPAAATLLAGIEVGALYYDQKVFEVVVWGVPAVRENPTDVADLMIETPNRGRVPLREVATVRPSTRPT